MPCDISLIRKSAHYFHSFTRLVLGWRGSKIHECLVQNTHKSYVATQFWRICSCISSFYVNYETKNEQQKKKPRPKRDQQQQKLTTTTTTTTTTTKTTITTNHFPLSGVNVRKFLGAPYAHLKH